MTAALSIRNLIKNYQSGYMALKGIDLEVQPGDFFALLGPNGAGKSTTIGIVTSLVTKTSGKVLVFGQDIDKDFSRAKSFIGLVPQEMNLNIFEPLLQILVNQAGYYGIPRSRALERAEYLLGRLGLWERRDDAVRTLSGGMKRRMMIARALIHDPKLVILDEPTAGVDIEIRHSMWEFLRDINAAGTTIILTTHYLEEAESLCRHIAIIDNGVLVENTTMKKLLAKMRTETFVLDLRTPLAQLPQFHDHEVRMLDDHTLEVEVVRDVGISRLFAELSSHNIDVLSMRNKTNRLEQLFMRLVEDNRRQQDAVRRKQA